MDPIVHKKGKIYYSMGEVAEMFDVNQSLIRFWEKKFDVLKPHKNKKGNRMFTPADVDNLKLIYHLVKEKGMTLAGAQKRIRENPEGVRRDMEVIDRLLGIKAILAEIREELKITGEEVYAEEGPGFADDEQEAGPMHAVTEAASALDGDPYAAGPSGTEEEADAMEAEPEELALSGEISVPGKENDDYGISFEISQEQFEALSEQPSLFAENEDGVESGAEETGEEPWRPRIVEQTLF